MNLRELKELKHNDTVIFTGWPAELSLNLEYKVINSGVGRMIVDDNGLGYFLHGRNLHELFEKKIDQLKVGEIQ